MPFTLIPPWTAWQQANNPLRLVWRRYTLRPVDIFPEIDLPPICCILPGGDSHAHSVHLLTLGRDQIRELPTHHIFLGDSLQVVRSEPAYGLVWVEESILSNLRAHQLLTDACTSGTNTAWESLYAYVNMGHIPVRSVAPLWDVTVAVGDARPGRVVESVNLDTEVRVYGVLQNVLAVDAYAALYRARVIVSSEPGASNRWPQRIIVCTHTSIQT